MAGYKAHVRREVAAKGYFEFRKTGVQYGHDGVKNLRYRLAVPQSAWTTEQTSGTHTFSYTHDGSTSRLPLTIECTGVGVAKARLRLQLPPDFGSFVSSGVTIITKRSAAITHLKLTLLKSGSADATINGSSISPSSSGVWQAFQFTPGGSYARADWVTIQVEASLDTIGDIVYIADLSLEYITARGHAL